MIYNPHFHHRRSIRLPKYDYSQPGDYFVTICTQNKQHYFGKIINQQIVLNNCGIMIEKWWNKLPTKFPNIQLDEYVIMPNHFHGIITIVRADPCVRPSPNPCFRPNPDEIQGVHTGANKIQGAHTGAPLHKMIQWFKTMTTNEYLRQVKNNAWPPLIHKLWQRNYYEHIVDDLSELDFIRDYISSNPYNWSQDKYN